MANFKDPTVSGKLGDKEYKTAAHFITLTFWESLQAIEAFAGEEISRAKYYLEDAGYLLEFEPAVQHWEVHS